MDCPFFAQLANYTALDTNPACEWPVVSGEWETAEESPLQRLP